MTPKRKSDRRMTNIDFRLHFTAETGAAALIRIANEALAEGARSLLLLAADANDCETEEIDTWLRACPVPVFGGVFPQLIHDCQNREHGFIVAGLSETVEVHNIPGLSDPSSDYFETLEPLFGGKPEPVTLVVLVDGMGSGISALLDSVFDVLGSEPVYFGGGAGSLSFVQKPCLFSNEGMLTDYAQLTALPLRLVLGVEHGWEKFAGPFVATSGTRNIVASLDFKPAFDVYQEFVEADSGKHFTNTNFFDIAKGYPFGMERPDGSIVVRDPITRDGTSMVCVGEVPINSVVYLLKGKPENLIHAAARGASRLPKGYGPAIMSDCISRVLYLGDDFVKEIEVIQSEVGPRPIFGMLTLGEIANGGDRCLEFYNKTLVLAATEY